MEFFKKDKSFKKQLAPLEKKKVNHKTNHKVSNKTSQTAKHKVKSKKSINIKKL